MSCFERAADLLTPDITLERLMQSIKLIPIPVQFDPENCVQPDHPGVQRSDIHFSESELALFKLSMDLGLTRDKLKAVIATISQETFNVKDISSDLFAKIDRAKINNIAYEVPTKLFVSVRPIIPQ